MKKTVKLMISISNKSNPITTNMNLILNEIMRCLHQLRTLISWRATIIQPIPTQIDITIIIIDIKMPRRVRKVNIIFQFLMIYRFYFFAVIICPSFAYYNRDELFFFFFFWKNEALLMDYAAIKTTKSTFFEFPKFTSSYCLILIVSVLW